MLTALIGIVMGSDSDWPVMRAAAEAVAEFGVAYEVDVVSAHRMPHEMLAYGSGAAARGLRVIIAGAGGAAHLPGMLASVTPLPVIGVPVPLKNLDGLDSLLSIVQMPAGVPVAAVAVGGARNAGLLAIRILAAGDVALRDQMTRFQARLKEQAMAKGTALRDVVGGSPLEEPGDSSEGPVARAFVRVPSIRRVMHRAGRGRGPAGGCGGHFSLTAARGATRRRCV